jgi:predicted SnoaL-like aldol condensation-catalyzing enzyme
MATVSSDMACFVKRVQEVASALDGSADRLHRVLGEGNFVLMASQGMFAGEHTSFYDLFRVEDDKIAENWDTIETIPRSICARVARHLYWPWKPNEYAAVERSLCIRNGG